MTDCMRITSSRQGSSVVCNGTALLLYKYYNLCLWTYAKPESSACQMTVYILWNPKNTSFCSQKQNPPLTFWGPQARSVRVLKKTIRINKDHWGLALLLIMFQFVKKNILKVAALFMLKAAFLASSGMSWKHLAHEAAMRVTWRAYLSYAWFIKSKLTWLKFEAREY